MRCEVCGGRLDWRSGNSEAHATQADLLILDDLAAAVWVQAYDRAWLGRDWRALERMITPDVVVMGPGFTAATRGRAAALSHFRATMSRANVHEYNATDLQGHTVGRVGVITYRWQLDWTVARERFGVFGRDILMLRPTAAGWQLAWRAQVADGADGRTRKATVCVGLADARRP
jgi:ketosteroid isomerase-like protein